MKHVNAGSWSMRYFVGAVVMAVALSSLEAAAAGGYSQKVAEKYISESEAAWVAAEVSGDPSTAKRILADDYVGVFPDGTVSNKATAVGFFNSENASLSGHLDYIHVRFFGNTAVAHGKETDTRLATSPFPSGSLIFTDVFVRRHGRWQVVNSEDQFQPLPKSAK